MSITFQAPPSGTIDLKDAPGVIFFFGLAGAGKTFVARLLGNASGRTVYDADIDLTEPMKQTLSRRGTFTDEMRDEFFRIVCDKILRLRAQGHALIVTQAAYRQKHRDYIQQRVTDVEFIHVCATDSTILSRLQQRGDWITPEYGRKMSEQFEPPLSGQRSIDNNGTQREVLEGLAALFSRK